MQEPQEQIKKAAKTYKRLYHLDDKLPPIEQDENLINYREYVQDVLIKRGGVKEVDAERYTKDMSLFINAISHDTVNLKDRSDNYEILEHLGDKTVNSCCTWYLFHRFPEIAKLGDKGVDIFSRQSNIIKSKEKLSKYCVKIGLSNFIRYRKLKFDIIKEDGTIKKTKKGTKVVVLDDSLKEDAFEAFCAATVMTIDQTDKMVGIGYAVVYNIIKSILDDEYISVYAFDLYDFKTQIKEVFDKRKKRLETDPEKDTIEYISDPIKNVSVLKVTLHAGRGNVKQDKVYFFEMSTKVQIQGEEDYETNKTKIEQELSKKALIELQKIYGDEFIRYKPNTFYL